MATVTDRLETEFVLKDHYTKNLQDIARHTGTIGGQMMGFFDRLKSIAQTAIGFAVRGIGLLAGGLTGLVFAASKASADMDALRRGLIAVAGSADAADIQLKRLQDVAKLPGLGFREAIQGSINLQAAGFSAEMAEAALKGFGNALATVGKGKEDLEGVIMALGQIASKGKISAEEINQLAERVPQIRRVMQAAFGTADTEALQKSGMSAQTFVGKVTQELLKLPQATGGAKNAFENFTDAAWRGLVKIGDVANKYLVPAMDAASGAIAYLADSGILSRIAQKFADLFTGGNASAKGLQWTIFYIAHLLEQMPDKIRGFTDSLHLSFTQVKSALVIIASLMTTIIAAQTIAGIIRFAVAVFELAKAWKAVAIAMSLTAGAAVLIGIGVGKYVDSWLTDKFGGGPKAPGGKEGKSITSVAMGQADNDMKALAAMEGMAKMDAQIEGDKAYMDSILAGGSGSSSPGAADYYSDQQSGYLKEIRDNTKKMADLSDVVYGGGSIGQAFTDRVHMSRATRGASGGDRPEMNEIMRLFNQIIDREQRATFEAIVRGGIVAKSY